MYICNIISFDLKGNDWLLTYYSFLKPIAYEVDAFHDKMIVKRSFFNEFR